MAVKIREKKSYKNVDCVAAFSSKLKALLFTGDPEFEKLEHEISIKWIAAKNSEKKMGKVFLYENIFKLITFRQHSMTSSVFSLLRVPIFSSNLSLSTVAVWLTTTTLVFGRFAMPFLS